MKPTILESSQVTTGDHGEGAKVLRLVPKPPEPKGSNTSILELLDSVREEVVDPENNVTRMVICYIFEDKPGVDSYWCRVAGCDTLQAVGLMHSCANDYIGRGREEAQEVAPPDGAA